MALFNDLYLKVLSAVNRDEEGQGLAEYALILALIAIVAIVALIFLGTRSARSSAPSATRSRTDPTQRVANAGSARARRSSLSEGRRRASWPASSVSAVQR